MSNSIDVSAKSVIWGGIAAKGLGESVNTVSEGEMAIGVEGIKGEGLIILIPTTIKKVSVSLLRTSPTVNAWIAQANLRKSLPFIFKQGGGATETIFSVDAALSKIPDTSNDKSTGYIVFDFVVVNSTHSIGE